MPSSETIMASLLHDESSSSLFSFIPQHELAQGVDVQALKPRKAKNSHESDKATNSHEQPRKSLCRVKPLSPIRYILRTNLLRCKCAAPPRDHGDHMTVGLSIIQINLRLQTIYPVGSFRHGVEFEVVISLDLQDIC